MTGHCGEEPAGLCRGDCDAETLRDLRRSLALEWLETNGLGGYAMGTLAGAHTRRYHGLLCAALRPPVDRRMLLSKLDEQVRVDGAEHALSCNLYGGVVHPNGHERLVGFRRDPWPTWTYEAGGARIEKSVIMVQGHNAVIVRYACLEAPQPVALLARPLLAMRDHHHLCRARVEFELQAEAAPGVVMLQRDGGPMLRLEFGAGAFAPSTEWYYNFDYPIERERGLDCIEDLYSPGTVEWVLHPGRAATLTAGAGEPLPMGVEEAVEDERRRREALAARAPEGDEVARTLFVAADQFIVTRPDRGKDALSIIAGYPWFTDWGRDTMIALPGLLLATGRHDEARRVLLTYADAMEDGLIPNVFPDGPSEAAYNTVDATLWFFVASRRYYKATRDLDLFADTLFDRMREAMAAHVQGTRHGIRMAADGLLTAGDETTQLTWMDAKVGDWVVTPRHGKAVEINALWHSAIRTMEFFARKLGEESGPYGRLARAVKEAFRATFWSDELGYCYDCVRGEERDATLRPNQVIALALPYSVLKGTQERSILRVVTERLLTPCGLRTLAPDHPGYRGRYEGDQWARDGAYHQGTVWPWLLGPYLDAYMAHSNRSPEMRGRVRELLACLVDHLAQAGLGTVSEIFDGDAPHCPRGCPAQAWSVAELLRVWVDGRLGEADPAA